MQSRRLHSRKRGVGCKGRSGGRDVRWFPEGSSGDGERFRETARLGKRGRLMRGVVSLSRDDGFRDSALKVSRR
jgi:hypothetical protein